MYPTVICDSLAIDTYRDYRRRVNADGLRRRGERGIVGLVDERFFR